MKPDFSKIFVNENSSINEALIKMALNKPSQTDLPGGIVLVVDKNQKLVGIATDGDIRRALSKRSSLKDKISKIMNKKPFLIRGPKSNLEILTLVVDKIKKENLPKNRLDKIIVVDENQRITRLASLYDLWQQTDVRFKHIGIVGLGYVGLTLGLTLADLGFKVRGLDINPDVRTAIQKGTPPFFEEGLLPLLKEHLDKNFAIVDSFKNKNNCDVYFISVGTPLDKDNKPSLKYIEEASRDLGKILKYGDTVILRSTVPIGTTRNVVIPILEKHSGLKAGEGLFVAFAPERTIEGRALEELRRLPQVIGGADRSSCDIAVSIFNFLTKSTVLVDSLEAAEMVKLINNTYRDVTFAFANEVSLIAQRWGIDTKSVIQAANYGYSRSNVPLPSPGVGGYCLEKDPYIFIESARIKNYEPYIFKHARQVSDAMIDHVAKEVIGFLNAYKKEIKNPKIVAMGLAFKGNPVTSDIRGSTGIKILEKLQQNKFRNIYGYDPIVRRSDVVARKIKYISDIKSGLADADVVLVLNNNSLFESLDMRKLLSVTHKPILLFDTWSLYHPAEMRKIKNVLYKRL